VPDRPALHPRGLAVPPDLSTDAGGLRLAPSIGGVRANGDLDHLQDADPVRLRDPGLPDGAGGIGDGRGGQLGRELEVRRGRDPDRARGTGDLAVRAGAVAAGRGPEADPGPGPGVL